MLVSPKRVVAALVHVLTASGSLFGLLALYFATAHRWEATFLSLGVALIIDGVDGPLARKIDINSVLPRFSGAHLDETVDYLNYCVVPAFIVMESEIIGGWRGVAVAMVILMVSLFHFADKSSKTADGYFVGFPAAWNVVCFYLFAFGAGEWVAIGLFLALALLVFVPVKWVHPLRVETLRPVTVTVVGCWALAAFLTVASGFPGHPVAQATFLLAAVYVIALGLWRSALPPVDESR
jgi:phosphatidylcholine synthase